jgi:hypothetical protein
MKTTREMARRIVALPQPGQAEGSGELTLFRNISERLPQAEQSYSYTGMGWGLLCPACAARIGAA